jgi:hypothetical protein
MDNPAMRKAAAAHHAFPSRALAEALCAYIDAA